MIMIVVCAALGLIAGVVMGGLFKKDDRSPFNLQGAIVFGFIGMVASAIFGIVMVNLRAQEREDRRAQLQLQKSLLASCTVESHDLITETGATLPAHSQYVPEIADSVQLADGRRYAAWVKLTPSGNLNVKGQTLWRC